MTNEERAALVREALGWLLSCQPVIRERASVLSAEIERLNAEAAKFRKAYADSFEVNLRNLRRMPQLASPEGGTAPQVVRFDGINYELASAAAPDERVLAERERCARICEVRAAACESVATDFNRMERRDYRDEEDLGRATIRLRTVAEDWRKAAAEIRTRTPDQDTAP